MYLRKIFMIWAVLAISILISASYVTATGGDYFAATGSSTQTAAPTGNNTAPRQPARQKTKSFEELARQFEAEKGLSYSERYRTINELGRCDDPRVVDFLINALANEKDNNLKSSIIRAIGQHKTQKAADFLLQQYKNTADVNQKRYFLSALASMPELVGMEFFIKALNDVSDNYAKRDVARALGKFKNKKALEALMQAYGEIVGKKNKNGRKTMDSYYIRALKDAMKECVKPDLLDFVAEELLASKKPHHRHCLRVFMTLIANEKLTAAVKNLIELLDDREKEIKMAAAETLAELKDPEAVKPLIEMADDSRDIDLICVAAAALGRIGDERARKVLIKLAGSRKWEVQSTALRALGNFPGEKSVELAIKGLDEREWQVQAAAVAALKELRPKESIEPLIDAMKKASGRLEMDIYEALKEITGDDLGKDYREWKKWWEIVKGYFKVPEKEDPEKAAEKDEKENELKQGADAAKKNEPDLGTELEEKPTFFGAEVVSNRVIFIIDISGSMSSGMSYGRPGKPDEQEMQRKIDVAKNELKNAVSKLKKRAYFNIYFFDTNFEKWQKTMVAATPRSKSMALEYIQKMQPRGGTNIFDPLEDALKDPNVDTIYLLSDGSPGSGKFVSTPDILREIRKINRYKNVKINTIGIRSNKQLMEGLAKENNGKYIEK